MSIYEKLKKLNLAADAVVTLTCSEGTDVLVYDESEIETALEETSVVRKLASLLAEPKLHVSTQYAEDILNSLRSDGLLESYERDGSFEDYLTEQLTENFYDQGFVESSTERYDHKRGFCTLSAKVQVSASEIISKSPYLGGWEASVVTDNGTLTFEA